MVQTLVDSTDRPGNGPLLASDGRVSKVKSYVMDFTTDVYTLGGEDISSIWSDFTEVLHIKVSQFDTNTAADRRAFGVDYTNKKLLAYTDVQTECIADDQTVIKVGLLAYGRA